MPPRRPRKESRARKSLFSSAASATASLRSALSAAKSVVLSSLGRRGRDFRGRVEGEVLARGPNVFAGYLNLPEKTEEAFTTSGGSGGSEGSEGSGGDDWFRTGDLGWIDRAGFLHITGRVSTMIVTEGGKHVQPDDVEEVYQAHPAIREIGILQKKDPSQLVAVIVPADRGGDREGDDLDKTVRQALDEQGRRLRPYERVTKFVLTGQSLPKTRMGKIQHHLLEEMYERATSRSPKSRTQEARPMSEAQMSGEDQELLRDPAARAGWDWLAERFPDVGLTPESSLRLDLQIDSMEWLNLTMEIGQRAGVELDEEAIGRVETARDLLQEISTASTGEGARLQEALDEPEKFLDEEQQTWLKPLSRAQAVLAHLLFSVNRGLMRVVFGVKGIEMDHLAAATRRDGKRGFVIAPNHGSYLDSFVIAAALDNALLRKTCWAGWTGTAFRGPLTRSVSRLARIVPIDPDRAVVSSLAFAAAVLKRGDNLVWFPEGARSPDGTLQPLRPGIGILLEHQPAVVVPAWIAGAHEAMPPGRFMPRPRPIRVTFGEPVDSQTLEREGEGDEPRQRITNGLQKRLASLARQPGRSRANPKKSR
jgi:long-chain acyl-CoA synthetase